MFDRDPLGKSLAVNYQIVLRWRCPCPASNAVERGPLNHFRKAGRVTKKAKASVRSVSHVDVYIGVRTRTLRLRRGLSQTALAERLGISVQQLRGYEQGQTRISAARLFDICDFFDVSLASMFERKIKV